LHLATTNSNHNSISYNAYEALEGVFLREKNRKGFFSAFPSSSSSSCTGEVPSAGTDRFEEVAPVDADVDAFDVEFEFEEFELMLKRDANHLLPPLVPPPLLPTGPIPKSSELEDEVPCTPLTPFPFRFPFAFGSPLAHGARYLLSGPHFRANAFFSDAEGANGDGS